MAKGREEKKSNGQRLSKPYDVENSFVKKVASRVSGYLGGWFGTPSKEHEETIPNDAPYAIPSTSLQLHEVMQNNVTFDPTKPPPSKRMRVEASERPEFDAPMSPIASTSRSTLFQPSVNHVTKSEDFLVNLMGPSVFANPSEDDLNQGNAGTLCVDHVEGGARTDLKANGADDNSESSESTSGCSSLIPQSDRLSQTAFPSSSRKQNLEEKLHYARQLKQPREHLYLNRTNPARPESSRKHSFDVSAYGSQIIDKSSVKEKMVTSPFYTGQTSYGGASAYRRARHPLSMQRGGNLSLSETRRPGVQLEVKSLSSHGSTEDLSNMSHTAKRILEALEQFSTPVSDVKRWPVSATSSDSLTPLGAKRRCVNDSRFRLSTPRSPLNPNAPPITTGLTIPTVPDLLKLKRLERIQNSTAAARQVAVPKQEYHLPTEQAPGPSREKAAGKMATKLKNKGKEIVHAQAVPVNLPAVRLPITTLPKFDLKLPTQTKLPEAPSVSVVAPIPPAPTFTKAPGSEPLQAAQAPPPSQPRQQNSQFVFSNPISVLRSPMTTPTSGANQSPRSTFTFSKPGKPGERGPHTLEEESEEEDDEEEEEKDSSSNFMYEAPTEIKLKLKPQNKSPLPMLSGIQFGTLGDKWECAVCMVRNSKDVVACAACSAAKPGSEAKALAGAGLAGLKEKPQPVAAPAVDKVKAQSVQDFGDKFKAATGSWECAACMLINQQSASKCVACESDNPNLPPPVPASSGFGDVFKKKSGQWECEMCMVVNKEGTDKCVACETPKPGAVVTQDSSKGHSSKANSLNEAPKFNFGLPPGGCGFTFGFPPSTKQTNGPVAAKTESTSVPAPVASSVSTPAGVFTFGGPAETEASKEKTTPTPGQPDTASNSIPIFSTQEKKGFSFPNTTDNQLSFGIKRKIESDKPGVMDAPAPASSPVKSASVTPVAPQFAFGNSTTTSEPKPGALFTFGQSKSPALRTAVVSPALSTPSTLSPAPLFQAKGVEPTIKEQPATTPATFMGLAHGNTTNTTAPFGNAFKASAENTKSSGFVGDMKPSGLFGNAINPILPASTASPFGSSPAFNGPNVPTTNAFGLLPTKSEASPAFGGVPISAAPLNQAFNTSSFGGTPGVPVSAFGADSATPASGFSSFGGGSSGFGATTSVFGSSSAPAAFGSGFPASSAPSGMKPAAPAIASPFIFGAKEPTNAPTPSQIPASVFSFGASNVESRPKPAAFGAPGQNGPSFSFGGAQQPMQPMQPVQPSFFGSSAVPAPAFGSAFNQNNTANAFAAAAAPKPSPSTQFQFSATPNPPASAPATTGFSLSVPPNFNFTGGQTPTFSAEPSAPASVSSQTGRRVIKALRRTHR